MCCCNLCPNNPSSAELTVGAQQILADSAKEGRKEGTASGLSRRKGWRSGSPLRISTLPRRSIGQDGKRMDRLFQHLFSAE